MELDELKKSWNALDEQLKKEPIADEKQIAGMIAEYKANARKSIGRLTGWQRFSIGIGVVGLALLLVIWLLPSIFQITEEWQPKINTLVIFVGISILIGILWRPGYPDRILCALRCCHHLPVIQESSL